MKKIVIGLLFLLGVSSAYADTKVSGLAEDSSPTTTDVLLETKDPGGTPASKKVQIGNILNLGTSYVPEGSNLYFTTDRATSAISGTSPIVNTNGVISLGNSGVSAGTYGSATQVSSVTVAANGTVTGAANVTISLTNSNLQSGTYGNVTVPAANVASGNLGNAVVVSSVAVGAVLDASIVSVSASKLTGTGTLPNAVVDGSSITKQGVLTAGTNITLTPGAGTLTIAATSSGGGGASTLAVGTGTAANFTTNVTSPTAAISFLGTQFNSVAGGTTNFISLSPTGVTANSYGSATQVPGYTVGADGRLSAASNTTISLTNSNLQSGTYSNVTVPAANVAGGNLGNTVIASSIASSGVTAGTYGTATQVSSVTINGDGRITSAANVTISLTNSNLQSGTYSNVTVPAANVATGNLGNAVMASSFPVTGVTAGSYTNTNLTVNAQGMITTAANGTAGGAGSTDIYPATATASFPFGMTVSTIAFLSPFQLKSVFLNAGSGLCQTTSGCVAPAQFQTATSSINYVAANFQSGTTQYWQTNFTLPRNYAPASTFLANFVWTTTMSVVTATWKIDMMSVTNTGAIDTAWGTAVTVSTASSTTGALNISQDSAAITAAGSPDINKELYIRVYRNGDSPGDARFLGVRLYYLYNKLSEN